MTKAVRIHTEYNQKLDAVNLAPVAVTAYLAAEDPCPLGAESRAAETDGIRPPV